MQHTKETHELIRDDDEHICLFGMVDSEGYVTTWEKSCAKIYKTPKSSAQTVCQHTLSWCVAQRDMTR